MTDEQAQSLLEQLRADSRLQVELTETKNRGKKYPALKIAFKRELRAVTIKQPEEWQGVKEAWGI